MDCAFQCEEYPGAMMGWVDPNRRYKIYCGGRLPYPWEVGDHLVRLPLVGLLLVGLLFGEFEQPRILVGGQGWVQI